MKITPLEIRQKTFEKAFRGLDKDEVVAFLISLSQEWEKVLDENKELRIKLEAAEKEVEKLREVESSLFKTLKTAEDTGASMMEQAKKTAELHLKETQIQAEALLNEAKSKSKGMIEESESTVKQTIDSMGMEVRNLMNVYKTMENLRDNLLDDLRSIANDVNEKVKRTTEKVKPVDFDEIIRNAHQQFDVIKSESSKPMIDKRENIMDNVEKTSKPVESEKAVLEKEEVEESQHVDAKVANDIKEEKEVETAVTGKEVGDGEKPEAITEVTSKAETKASLSENADAGSDNKTAKNSGPSKSFFDDI